MRIAALIFDVDGVLADTEEAHRRAFNAAFAHLGLAWDWTPERYRELLAVTGGKERLIEHIDSLGLPEGERRRLAALVPEVHAEKTRRYTADVRAGQVPLRPGIARLAGQAKAAGLKIALASTTTRANIDALCEAAFKRGSAFFDSIATGDAVPRKKPAPDVYLLALEELQIDARDAVAFEDSEAGVRAACAAGLWTVATPTTWTENDDLSLASLVLPSLGDPETPLAGEPGGRLTDWPWLTLPELERLRAAPRPGDGGAAAAPAHARVDERAAASPRGA